MFTGIMGLGWGKRMEEGRRREREAEGREGERKEGNFSMNDMAKTVLSTLNQ